VVISFKHIFLLSLVSATLLFGSRETVSAQILADDFSNSDLTSNPEWAGNLADFTVNASNQLQMNSALAGQSYISSAYSETDMGTKEWSFWIKQSFAGSDNNQSRFYIASNGPILNYSGNGSSGNLGYFLRFGEGGSADAIKLFRDDGAGNPIEILSGSSSFIAASFAIRVKITRDNSGLWSIFADSSGGLDYAFQSSTIDNTYTTSTHTGWICNYTITNADNFFLDDLYFGDIQIDETPPALISATAIAATQLDVLFNESLALNSAEIAANYNVAGIGSPALAQRDNVNFALVHLSFSQAFPANETQSLTVSNIEDNSSNILLSSTADFVWFQETVAAYRSIVFNEVLADPTPLVGLAEAEFLELYNASDEIFNLQDWTFVNSATPKILPSFLLAPGEFVVLCDESNTSFFTSAIGISSFTALTNDEDSLTLLNSLGEIIDVLVYSSDWFDSTEKSEGGWSLEQINPQLPCQGGASNWGESEDSSGGTPGSANSIFNSAPDNVSPQVINHGIIDVSTLFLDFSEPVDTSSSSPINWSLIPFNAVIDYSWNNSLDGVQMGIQFPLQSGSFLQLTVGEIADCTGNVIAQVNLEFVLGSTPQPGDILITEIMADPDPAIQAPPAEYIEILNLSNQLLDLAGMSINSGIIESQVLVEPGAYVVIGDNSNTLAFLSIPNKYLFEDFPGLTNSGTTIALTSSDGALIDEVSYNIDWYNNSEKADGGWSLEIINPFDPCSDKSNWTASSDSRGGTAGEINSVYDDSPDIDAPEFRYLLMQPQESVSLFFDEPLNENSVDQILWIVDGIEIPNDFAVIDFENPNVLILYFGEMEENIIHSFVLSGISDCWGNEVIGQTGFFGMPDESETGDLIINEILTDPFENGSDFIEIYNHSSKIISLQDWNIANGENAIPDDIEMITEEARILFPGEYLVLTEDPSSLPSLYPYTRTSKILQVETLPSFAVSADEVFLIIPDGSISDHVPYSEDMHYPLLNSTDGVSLERISIDRLSDDRTNWHSAAESQGFATPGYINSQAFTGGFSEGDVSIDPEIFSPDNDGYQDVTTISYANNSPGWVANVSVFDSEGRKVRTLRSNELIGNEGSISWDGFTDDRIHAPIGIYIIFFEAFDKDGHVNSVKKTCVLAQKLN